MDAFASNTSSKRDYFFSYCYTAFKSGWLVLITTISALLHTLMPLPALSVESRIHFTDVTDIAGIHFKHTDGAIGEFHLPETLGAGGAFLDYDNDGDLDIYLVNSAAPSMLYRNNGDGTFTDVTPSAGIDNQRSYGHGVACGDYDNDGYVDIYVTNFGANRLYRNNGDGTFTDVTTESGTEDSRWSSSATFFDYNSDGDLDLYVVNYLSYKLDASYPPCFETPVFGATEKVRGYCHPKHFEGAPDRLYRNNGDGTFTDVTEAANVRDPGGIFLGKGLGVVAADFDADGNPDIYIANDDTPNYLFYNKGDGTFADIAILTGCAYSEMASLKPVWVLMLVITTATVFSISSSPISLMRQIPSIGITVTELSLMSVTKHNSARRVISLWDSAPDFSMPITMDISIFSSRTGIFSRPLSRPQMYFHIGSRISSSGIKAMLLLLRSGLMIFLLSAAVRSSEITITMATQTYWSHS